ncbi:hypothetical protein CASFOL_018524 [Castilleja foliolosa]|uniref:Transposase n=1 Tax=Castilleja foliolosa TaxID=1961234 RepID=A0ABD3D6F3_9LAMI
MIHLIIHLVSEIRVCDPVHLRWMYPFERYMKILKGYVKNPHLPEASMDERYVAEEAIEFCTQYLSETKLVGHPTSRHVDRGHGKGTIGGKVKNVDREEVLKAHLYILNNTPEVQPYLDTHLAILKEQNPKQMERWIVNAHNKSFSSWFKDHVQNEDSTTELIGWLVNGPNFDVLFWQGYDINGYSFYTKDRDDKSTMQNSGVTLESESMYFSSSKDKNLLRATSSHYGIIEENWEIDYLKFKIPVFRCKWVDGNNGVKVDEIGVTLVDFSKVGSKNEPFVMASQVKQVFYITDPSNKNVFVVLHGKRILPGDDDESNLDVYEISTFSSGLPDINSEIVIDDVHAVIVDHTEGIWENVQTLIEGGSGRANQPVVPEQPVVEQSVVKSIPTRRARKSTHMERLTLRYPGKVKIVFDSRRLMAIGPQKKIIDNFRSYLGFLGRKQPIILIKSWKLVSANTKELIWQAILEKFEIYFVDGDKEVEFSLVDVKLRDKFRKKYINYVGRRWAVFKTNLTTTFIYGKKKDEPPYVKVYEFLDKETWEAFIALRLSEEEKTKRLKAQETQSHNKCPQRCSRGDYEVLTQKIIDEKYKARQVASDDPSEIIPPPSPSSRHETWKRELLKPTGEFVNQETSVIAAKIDALEQEQSSGSFTPSGRNDILAVAIGKPDHPTSVRGVCKGYMVRTYFGKQQRAGDGMVSREEMAVIIAEMKAEMQAEMRMILSTQVTSTGEPEPHTPQEEEEHGGNEVGKCELYVENPHKRLVAYGRIHELGSNIHHGKMNDDEVRVSVERIIISDALVPFPTEEVTKVGEASNQFIAWPRRLVVENVKQGNSQRELFPKNSYRANQKPQATPVNKMDVLKTLWIAAADIKESKILRIEVGIVGLTRTSVHINQVDIM